MSKNTPTVQHDQLHYFEDGQSRVLPLDSAAWFDWLNRTSLFAFISDNGTFTARLEVASNGRGGSYWRAYRKREGKLYRAYLGKTLELTSIRLAEIARKLAEPARSDTTTELVQSEEIIMADSTPPSPAVSPLSPNVLVATKLFVPNPPGSLLVRPRLSQKLQLHHSHTRLTLLSAPAGFGKTTAVAEWLQQYHAPAGATVGWVSLDEGDNELVRFWSYFIQALQVSQPGFSQNIISLLRSTQPPPIELLLANLINQLTGLEQSFTLVLDDFHLITNPLIHQGLTFLITHQPPQLHLVIISRTDPPPPLPLAKMRMRGQLNELRTADLRFSFEEVCHFLIEVMGLKVLPASIAELDSKTEGWIAALQLAALLMQSYPDTTSFIKSFNGQQRFMLDYLAEEVLQHQSQEVQDFLLHTSIVDRLNASLAEELTGCEDGQAFLKHIEQANLFLIPLDGQEGWYRYHHLFQHYLRNRLLQTKSNQLPLLHLAAAHWFDTHQLRLEAIEHALVAQDYDYAANLIDRTTQQMYERSETKTLLRWLEALPTNLVYRDPRVSINYAWVLVLLNRIEEALSYVQAAQLRLEQAKTANDIAAPDLQAMQGEIAAAQAFIERKQGKLAHSIALGQQALDLVPSKYGFLRCAITINQAHCLAELEDVKAATKAYAQAEILGRECNSSYFVLTSILSRAKIYLEQGELRQAQASSQRALHYTQLQLLPIVGFAHLVNGRVWLERNELEQAERSLSRGIDLLNASSDSSLLMGYIELARVRQYQADFEECWLLLMKAEQILFSINLPVLHRQLEQSRVRFWLASDNLAAAEIWAEQDPPANQAIPAYVLEIDRLLLGRIRAAQNRLSEALELVSELPKTARAAGRKGILVEAMIVQATLYSRQGEANLAEDTLLEALQLAEPEGFIRLFVDEGEWFTTMLNTLAARVLPSAFISAAYLAALRAGSTTPITNPTPIIPPLEPKPVAALTELLTERELTILRLLIKTSLTSTEIADQLVIAVSTVRTHIKNIYSKLEVNNRLEVVARAHELGLSR